jgi:hypothetical protein
MNSKNQYISIISSVIAATYLTVTGIDHKLLPLIKRELTRILRQTDFNKLDNVYDYVVDFFTRVDQRITLNNIEDLAKITELTINNTISDFMSTSIESR